MMNLALRSSYICLCFDGIFNKPKNLTTWGRQLYFPSEGRESKVGWKCGDMSVHSELEFSRGSTNMVVVNEVYRCCKPIEWEGNGKGAVTC
jgi:hypothetical protein